MKKLIIILFAIIISCKNEEVEIDITEKSEFSFNLNGVDCSDSFKSKWFEFMKNSNQDRSCKNNYGLSMNILSKRSSYFRQSINIMDLPFKVGAFKPIQLLTGQVCDSDNFRSFIYEIDDDVILAEYRIDETVSDNIVMITKIDSVNKFVEGNFNLKFKKKAGWEEFVDVLEFKNGYFKAYYKF